MDNKLCDCGELVTDEHIVIDDDNLFECSKCGLLWARRGEQWIKAMIDDNDQIVLEGESDYCDS